MDRLTKKCIEARKMGLTYGQYEAMRHSLGLKKNEIEIPKNAKSEFQIHVKSEAAKLRFCRDSQKCDYWRTCMNIKKHLERREECSKKRN